MRSQFLVIPALVLAFCILDGSVLCAAPPNLQTECASELSKVGVCLPFAIGKSDKPTKDCCSTVDDIKTKHAVCLCYFIQQVHHGGAQVKQLGVQESKLFEIPSACKLANVSFSECPALLGLAPDSPDNKIFTAPNKSVSSAPTANTTGSLPKDSSVGFTHGPFPIAVVITIAIFLSVFPVGFSSMFYLGA